MPRCSSANFCGLTPHVAAQLETSVPATRYVPTAAERHMSSTNLESTRILHDHLGRVIKGEDQAVALVQATSARACRASIQNVADSGARGSGRPCGYKGSSSTTRRHRFG